MIAIPHSQRYYAALAGDSGISRPDIQMMPGSSGLSAANSFPFPESGNDFSAPGLVLPGSYLIRPTPSPVPYVEIIEPPANQLIDLLKHHYPAFEQRHPLPANVRHAMQMVQYCHTDALGGHVERCPDGHVVRVFYNCCGHRWCPRCAGRKRLEWLERRRAKLLPVRHYHVVFTVSHRFNDLWRLNPRVMGDLLFRSATGALRALLADPDRLGVEPGITATLETWDDRLCFHPHLHCLVTGGGLTPEGEWKDVPNPRCLVAVRPLMWEFRKRFCRELRELLEQEALKLPEGTTLRQWFNTVNKANRQKWGVFIAKPPEEGGPTPDEILRYQADDVAGGPLSAIRLIQEITDMSETQLAYLKSSPLSASRLGEAAEETVSFRWGEYNQETGMRERDQIETLPVEEFLRRYLQHVPPSNSQIVRHYGLYAGAKKAARERCRELLSDRQQDWAVAVSREKPEDDDAWKDAHLCSVCGKALVVSSYIPSSVTGKVIPRVRLGHVYARPPNNGGAHEP